jgi:hypothetical protein
MAVKHSVKIKNYSDVIEELVAGGAITPGHLIALGSAGTVAVHAVAGGNALPPMFALEDELQGKTIDDAYASGNRVQVWIPNRGDVVNALLKDGENIAKGDLLESAGDGTLQKHVADVDSSNDITSIVYPVVGQAIEAIDLSGSSGTHPTSGYRIQIRIV